jgi:hypothetical protein
MQYPEQCCQASNEAAEEELQVFPYSKDYSMYATYGLCHKTSRHPKGSPVNHIIFQNELLSRFEFAFD